MLLINKADYLTPELREHWSTYFKQNNINHAFFSALVEQEKIDKHEVKDEDDESEEDEKLIDKETEEREL